MSKENDFYRPEMPKDFMTDIHVPLSQRREELRKNNFGLNLGDRILVCKNAAHEENWAEPRKTFDGVVCGIYERFITVRTSKGYIETVLKAAIGNFYSGYEIRRIGHGKL